MEKIDLVSMLSGNWSLANTERRDPTETRFLSLLRNIAGA
jgi:hypothetical protein